MLVPSSIASGSDLVQSCRVCTIDHPGMLMALFHYPNQLLESGEKGSWLMPLLELIVTTLQPSLFALGAVYWPFKARFGKAGLPPQPRCLERARSEPIYGETGSSERETEREREREREREKERWSGAFAPLVWWRERERERARERARETERERERARDGRRETHSQ